MTTIRPLRSIYQLKISLKRARPPIWRRIQVDSTDNLEDVHIALQIVMGWTNSHLHEFVCGRDRYGIPDEDYPSDLCDEVDYRLDQVLRKEKDKLTYEYDFGDGWGHDVVLEKILPFDSETVLPVCLTGRRACPPEDVGGIGGYEMFLETLADPSHAEHEEMLEWIGGDFDAEHFDLAVVNDLLREYCDEIDEPMLSDMDEISSSLNNMFTELNEKEFRYLDDFLLDRVPEHAHSDDEDEGILDMSELDGFFTAIVSGPVMVPPSQWLPAIWGDFEPEWESEKDFELVFSLLMRHMNGIATTLTERPDDFKPIFMERVVDDNTHTVVDEWCEGYHRALALTSDLWHAGGQEMTILLTPILAFTRETEWRGHDYTGKEFENLQKAIVPNVREIHAYWLTMRDHFISESNTPIRRSEPRVGRNEPCPCGSGKKYKKCCLH